jgi:hypothetical protein
MIFSILLSTGMACAVIGGVAALWGCNKKEPLASRCQTAMVIFCGLAMVLTIAAAMFKNF